MKNEQLKENLRNFVVFIISYTTASLLVKSKNIWYIFIITAILGVFLNGLFEKLEYKILRYKARKREENKEEQK